MPDGWKIGLMGKGQMTKTADKVTARDVMGGINIRYQVGQYVVIPEAPSANVSGRSCDAIAIGVWASTGNPIIGHEIKVSRSDWLHELDQPEKSEAFLPYCHQWYIAAPKGIVKLEELRAEWGLMELVNGKMKIRRQATKTTPKPLPNNMLASWMRRVFDAARRPVEAEQQKHINELAEEKAEFKVVAAKRKLERLEQMIARFEEASGVKLQDWRHGEVGRAVRKVLDGYDPTAEAKRILRMTERLAESVREAATPLIDDSNA